MAMQALPAQPPPPAPPPRRLLIPKAPVLVMDGHRICALTTDGELKYLTPDQARKLLSTHIPVVCHAASLAKFLRVDRVIAYDVLELFAFVHPGVFCVPTPGGIAAAMHLLEPVSAEDRCLSLRDSIRHLLTDLTAPMRKEASDPAALAAMMGMTGQANDGAEQPEGWLWAPSVLAALGRTETPPGRGEIRTALKIWEKLPEWAQHAPEPPAGHLPVTPEEAEERLHRLRARQKKEDRPAQKEYSHALTHAFSPCDAPGEPRIVLAEAGTGVGKTLGYLAPATLWAEKNGGAVWVSTYTRNLQRQAAEELKGLYDDPITQSRKVVTRKGRDNYLCLLNLEDATQSPTLHTSAPNAIALGLMLRWVALTGEGDLGGSDFPGWLPGLLGWHRVHSLADRRGECIYSACPHFNRCFIEKSLRKAARADIVIANHALVMHQLALGGEDDALPGRFVFDEGHHLFDAADGVFSGALTGGETAELRRWILGVESDRKSRARGLKRRLEEIIADDDAAKAALDLALEAARGLPGPQWRQRLAEESPKGVTENFLLLCRQQVYARNKDLKGFYALETATQPVIPGLADAAYALSLRLRDLQRPLRSLAALLRKKLVEEAEDLETTARERLRYTAEALTRRAENVVGGWLAMLESLLSKAPEGVIDWLEITRIEGRDDDGGLFRAALDPAALFAAALKPHVQGAVVTSATLRDRTPEDAEGWASPLARTGVAHLTEKPELFSAPSPFDYARQTRILVVKDVRKENPDEVAAAYRALFLASGGGALGIFTAVQRLRAVQERLQQALEENGIPLYAQHVDPLDTATLIDIFRAEENACLLGTDATRDGIDVPGRSLRLAVYDRVPWPRPTLLHKARRAHFGKNYDDMLARFRLKQAFGRLIRTATDKGIFVMLDAALPTRLTTAFPAGIAIERIGLKEAVDITRAFLKQDQN